MVQTDKPKVGITVTFGYRQIDNKEANKIFNEYHINPHDVYWLGEHEDLSNVYVFFIEKGQEYEWQEKMQKDERIETANIFSTSQALTKGRKKRKIIRVFAKNFLIFPVSITIEEFKDILQACNIFDDFSVEKTNYFISRSEFVLTVPAEKAHDWKRALDLHPKIEDTMVFGETYEEEKWTK